MRFVGTLRCGSMSPQLMREWEQHWKPKKQAGEEKDCTPTYPEGTIVPAEYGWLPRPNDKIARPRGASWEKTAVKSVFHNFVAYAAL
jgi:hypothetical protein